LFAVAARVEAPNRCLLGRRHPPRLALATAARRPPRLGCLPRKYGSDGRSPCSHSRALLSCLALPCSRSHLTLRRPRDHGSLASVFIACSWVGHLSARHASADLCPMPQHVGTVYGRRHTLAPTFCVSICRLIFALLYVALSEI